jgi:hypothetical protein
MVGPVALYPDPLLAETLAASTFPGEIVLADRFVASGQDAALIAQQSWDPSVKSLTQFPALLKWLDDNLVWTTAVGQAFMNQETDLMDAVQRLRVKAQALGNLQSTPEDQVVADDGDIDILPGMPDSVFLPVYDPSQVFYDSPPPGGSWVTYGAAAPVNIWFAYDIAWHGRKVIYWPRPHPRPREWWNHSGGRRPKLQYSEHGAVVWTHRARAGRKFWSDDERRWTGNGVRIPMAGGAAVAEGPVREGIYAVPRPAGAAPVVELTGAPERGEIRPVEGHGQPAPAMRPPPLSPPPAPARSEGGGGGSSNGNNKPR